MSGLALLLLVASSTSPLAGAANSSLRPHECRRPDPRSSSTGRVWQRARHPRLKSYCRLLARGYFRLNHSPKDAEQLGKKAQRLIPQSSAPLLLMAKASLRQAKYKQAAKLFRQSLKLNPAALRNPEDLFAYAKLLKRQGDDEAALRHFRQLLPQTQWLARPDDRPWVLLEVAHLLLRMPTKQAQRRTEALNYLREAQRSKRQRYRRDVALSLALVLGASNRAARHALLGEESGLLAWAKRPLKQQAYASPWVAAAMQAIALETAAPIRARQHWQQLLKRTDLPSAQHNWVTKQAQAHQGQRRRRP